MQSESERKTMACPLNGKMCADGIREDFAPNPSTGRPLTCRWWQHVSGKDPQSEKIIDHFDCSIPWMPILMVENSQMQRFTAASVDKVATEVAKTREIPIQIELQAPEHIEQPRISLNGHKPDRGL